LSAPLIFRVYKNDQIYVVKQFVNDERVILGSGGGAHINLDSSEISAIHCLIERRGDGYFLCDLGSVQGTFIGNKTVLDQQINSGDSFSIGPFRVFFLIGHQKNVSSPATEADALSVADMQTATVSVPIAEQVIVKRPAAANRGAVTPTLKDVVRVGQGTQAEVIVSWHERVLNTYHFSSKQVVSVGTNADVSIPLPQGSPQRVPLLQLKSDRIEIFLSSEMNAELLREGEYIKISDDKLILKTNEACYIELSNGIQLAIRFAPKSPPFIFASPIVIGISEFIGVLASLILAVVTSLVVSVSKPKAEAPIEDTQILAQVIFTPPKMPITPPDPNEVTNQPPTKVAPQLQPPEPVVQKIELSDQNREAKIQGPTNVPIAQTSEAANSGQATAIKPKEAQLKAKMFTSTKQGGAVKTGANSAANAKSKEPDLNNTGLLAAFGTGGARTKLDKAYNGSGELIGAGEKATGSSGFNSDRAGNDLGSRAKDTGAGGMGTATQGITGVGTQGRGTGMAGMGTGTGFGNKGKVQIVGGGSEEAFVGSIDKEAVRRVVKSALQQFKACYEREYHMNSKLEGKVVVQWEIHAQGVAKNAIVIQSRSTLNNPAVEECVKNRMMALKFPEPPPGTAAEVTYPFIFQGQKL
jgi:hypothetical protein